MLRVRAPSPGARKSDLLDHVRQPANFVVEYDTGDKGPHGLLLGNYGKRGPRDFDRWVLLEEPSPANDAQPAPARASAPVTRARGAVS